MSVKIYYAYRMPAGAFSPAFLPAFREHCFAAVAKYVRKLAGGRSPEAVRVAFIRAKKASQSPLRSEYDIDCRLNVWFRGRHAYAIPGGEAWIYEGFSPPAPAEDYAYWNNTDRPDGVTARAWLARSKAWEAVCLDDWDRCRLVHTVVDVVEDVGLLPVARRIVKEKDVHKATWLH